MSEQSTLSHVVESQLYTELSADAHKKCEQLLRTEAVSDDVLESLIQSAISDGRARSLEVLLHHATTRPSFELVSAFKGCYHLAHSNTLTIVLDHCRRHSCDACMDVTEFSNYITYRANSRDFPIPARIKCAALILVHDETWPDRHRRSIQTLQDHVRQSKNAFRANALTSITSEPMLTWAAFALIRRRATEICIAMQDLCLPAPITIEILEAACYPPESHPKHYDVWRLVTKVKHFLPRD